MKTRFSHIVPLIIFFLLISVGFFSQLNAQTTVGPNLPVAGANDASYGTVAWTNPDNILTNNNVYATVTVNNSTSNYLQALDFGFSIPEGAVIVGIQVTFGRRANSTLGVGVRDNVVSLLKNGNVVGDNKANTGTDWPTSETAANYGSTTDTWGESWTGADINASNFGFVLAVSTTNTSDRIGSVDYIQITVTYSRYFQSAESGNWNATATWEESADQVSWTSTAVTPTNANSAGIFIRYGHVVTVSNDQTVDQVTVEAGGQVTITSGDLLTVANGTEAVDMSVSGTVLSNSTDGNGGITTTGVLALNDGGMYHSTLNGDNLPIATWSANSTCYLTGVTSTIPGNQNQTFGNFKYECNQTGDESFAPAAIAGNLEIVSISTGAGNELRLNVTTLNVGGNFSLSDGTFRITSGANRTLNVAGNVTISGGSLLMNDGTNVGTLNVAGDFTHSGGTITETGSGTGAITFNGSSMQIYTSGGTISNTINFTINNGAYLQMDGASTTVDGDGTFTLASGGTLGITASDGIATSGAAGNLRVTGTRTFNAGANYIYNGTGAQSSGNGLPLTVNSLTLGGTSDFTFTNSPSFATPFNVTSNCSIGSGTILTIGSLQSMTVSGTLTNNAGTNGLIIKSDASGTGSLINGTNGVDAKVERYLTQNVWHYTSSPISDALSGVFTDIYLRTFDEATDDWNPHITPTNVPLDVMLGYAAWVPGSNPVTVNFEGALNTGSQSINVTRNTTEMDQGWNLIGNPYPSALDWDVALGWTKTNVNNTIYYYSGNGGLGNYKYYIGSGGETPGVGTAGGSQYIPAMQGFFVHSSADGSISVNNNARVHDTQAYYKDGKTEIPLIRLQAEGNEQTDETVIRFYSGAQQNFDNDMDAYKLFGNGYPQIYSVTPDQTALAISTLPMYNDDLIIPVEFIAPLDGEYTLSVTELIEFDGDLYLEDLKANIIHKLTMESEYIFTSSPLDEAGRFLLHFSNPMGVENLLTEPISIYAYKNTVYVQLPEEVKSQIMIYSLTGQLISQQQTAGQELARILLNTKTGYYIVKVQTGDQFFTEKVFIK